jgi:ATP-binding cassette subfamily B protein
VSAAGAAEPRHETQALLPARRGRLERIWALFNVDGVADVELGDLAMDVNKQWQSGWEETSTTGFWAIARRLPQLLRLTLSLAATASKARTVWMLIAQVVAGGCQAVSLVATTGVLAALFAGHPTPQRVSGAVPSLIVIAVFIAVQSSANAIVNLLSAQLGPRMDQVTLLRLHQVSTTVELAAFDQAGWADAAVKAERGAVSPNYLLTATVRFTRGAVSIVSAAVVLAVVSPILLPLLALTIVPKMWAQVRSARMGYVVFVRHNEGRRRQNQITWLGQHLAYAPEIRALGLAPYLLSRYRRLAAVFEERDSQLARAQALSGMIGDALSGIAMGATYVLLLVLLFTGWVPIAIGGTAYFAMVRVNSALASLVTFVNNLYTEGLYTDGYDAFTARAEELLPPAPSVPTPQGFSTITVEDVSFTYTGADRPAVTHATLEIRAGQVVALVGDNGAAKTTLTKLLARLYLPDTGRICWDGADIAEFDAQKLRAQIAYIAQDGLRAPFTAAENIRIGAWQDVEDLNLVQEAARRADAHGFITALPHGYDTLMDRTMTAGSNISGGQWQRLTLARGLLRNACLVLADEPTAHLDASNEIAFYRDLRAYGGTVVLVTHRMNAVRACADYIYVIEHGAVSGHGTHEQLMAYDNWYRDAFLLQRQSFHTENEPEPSA